MNALLIISYYLKKTQYNIQVDDPVYRRFLQETVEAKQKERKTQPDPQQRKPAKQRESPEGTINNFIQNTFSKRIIK